MNKRQRKKRVKEVEEEVLILSTEEALSKPGFFEALMDFQYGNQKASDAAFKRITKKQLK